MSAICELAKIVGFLNLSNSSRVLRNSFSEPKLFFCARNLEQKPQYFLLKSICRYFLLLSLMSLFVFNSCVRVGCVLMLVMSVTKRGNQHFYFYTLHRAGAGAMIKFKLETLLCDHVTSCVGRGEIIIIIIIIEGFIVSVIGDYTDHCSLVQSYELFLRCHVSVCSPSLTTFACMEWLTFCISLSKYL